METLIPRDSGLSASSAAPSPRLVPRIDKARQNPPEPPSLTRSGAVSSRGQKPGAHPPARWEVSPAMILGDIHAMEVLSSSARECCVLPVRIEAIDGDKVTVSDVRDIRRWYVGRINRDSNFSRARIVAGDLSSAK